MPRVDTESFYRNALARYGENAEGVHWHSTASQQERFRVIRELLPDDLSRLTLVDVGCGLGDLHRYLAEHDSLPRCYIGIDVVEPMVALARARTGCRILHCDALSDPLPTADWYVSSGAMNLMTRDETRRFIERCLAAASTGMVFNLLKGADRSMTFNYLLPSVVDAWAGELDVEMRVVEGYLLEDFSVALAHRRGE